MITIYDTKTRLKHNLDGLGGPTPVLLIKDHVQHLTDHQLEHHQLVSFILNLRNMTLLTVFLQIGTFGCVIYTSSAGPASKSSY